MNFFKTFLIVLLTSLLAIAKTGYVAAADLHNNGNVFTQDEEENHPSFEKSHHSSEHHLFGIDLEEEEEDSKEKKRLNALLSCSISFEPSHDFTPHRLGCTCRIKGISEMQSIRLHLIIQKFQI